MRADENVDLTFLGAGDDVGLLLFAAETREAFDAAGVVGQAFAEGLPVLLGEDGGGDEYGDLPAELDGFEGGADGKLGLAVPDITAEEAVHRAATGHVALDIAEGGELVGGFRVDERVFELGLPGGVG